jgi:carbamoyltransferase
MTAYQGRNFSDTEIQLAILEYLPWLDIVNEHRSYESVIETAAEALSKGLVVAWFQGRSEFGQRALGCRSILANPDQSLNRHIINDKVKKREWYRPLAPAVLAEHIHDWFELTMLPGDDTKSGMNISPYMSITALVKSNKVDEIPAVCHIDRSARLQTVTREDNTLFYDLIRSFYQKTGKPMVLNTSFNGKGEPIVETPRDALKCLLASRGNLQKLFIGSFEISVKPFQSSMMALDAMIFAQQFYLSEIITVPGKEAQPLRIRIQDGERSSKSNAFRNFAAITTHWTI